MGRRDKEKAHAKRKERKTAKRASKAKAGSTSAKGLRFEQRAARALTQIKPDVAINHDERLFTEPGHPRQFDVVGRVDGVLTHTYEARDHGRKVGIEQIEAFETKNATLQDKPRVAGLVSARGFWESPLKWVRHYAEPGHDKKYVQELYQLRSSAPEDWNGDIRELLIRGTGQSLKTLTVQIVYGDTVPEAASRDVTLTSGRRESFVHDKDGRIVANLIDLVNSELRKAHATGEHAARFVALPQGSYLTVGSCTRLVTGIEVGFEPIAVPSEMLLDRSGRYPDTLIDALTGTKWLIEDRTTTLKASRTGFSTKLAFTGSDEPGWVDIQDLPDPPELEGAGIPAGLAARAAAVSLQAALAVSRAGAIPDDVPPRLVELAGAGRAAMLAGNEVEAEKLYIESLSLGTALDALCSLAYLASKRGDHQTALSYSIKAKNLFPLEPEGFSNLAASYLALREYAKARRVIDQVRFLHGFSVLMRRQEADLLFRECRFREAADLFFELALDEPTSAALVANLARCEHALGDVSAAAWDASRAALIAPADAVIAAIAAAYAEEAKQPERVLEIAQRLVDAGTELPISVARRAVNACLAQKDLEAARGWLERSQRSTWAARDFAMHAQLVARLEGAVAGLPDARAAFDVSGVTDEIRIRLADLALFASSPADALAMLGKCSDPRAARLRALACAAASDGAGAIRSFRLLPDGEADRVALECMSRCPNRFGSDLTTLTQLTDWLLDRESNDAIVMNRQAFLCASRACATRSNEKAQRALALVARVREAEPGAPNVDMAEVLALIAAGRSREAEVLAKNVAGAADLLAAGAYIALEGGAMPVAHTVAEKAASCGEPLVNFPVAELHVVRVLSALGSGMPIEDVRRIVADGTLPGGLRGMFARGMVAYAEGKLSECAELLAPFVAPPRRMMEAFRIRVQCLAELGAFDQLLAIAHETMPSMVSVLSWAAERAVGQFDAAFLPAVAAACALNGVPDFVAVAETANMNRVFPGPDWTTVLKNAFQTTPSCDRVWIARARHPAEYIRAVLTQKPMTASE